MTAWLVTRVTQRQGEQKCNDGSTYPRHNTEEHVIIQAVDQHAALDAVAQFYPHLTRLGEGQYLRVKEWHGKHNEDI